MGRVEGKTVIVTGAARGMGRAIGHRLVEEGANVVFADMNESGAQEAASAATSAGPGDAIGMAVDVRNREQTKALVDEAVSKWGRLDVMFNNAGVNKPEKFLDTTEENWQFIMDVNALGVMLGMQEAIKQMLTQDLVDGIRGKVINTGSIVGRDGMDPNVAPYSVSKFGVFALTQMGAREFSGQGITVNSFAPGVVATELWEVLDGQLVDLGIGEKKGDPMRMFSENILLGRVATPDDITGTTTFLASSDSNYMTGQTLMIDGGMVLD
jgi:meso-butanediol dehydrogenase/(S,S)-butanediol dehydrogenase/diacetyl reductase